MLSWISPQLHWRMTCPDTIEAVALDFIDGHMPLLRTLSEIDLERIDDGDPWFAYRRRISAIYGISTTYCHPDGRKPKQGWNRRMWRRYKKTSPEQLVEQVFDTMIELLRTSARDSYSQRTDCR